MIYRHKYAAHNRRKNIMCYMYIRKNSNFNSSASCAITSHLSRIYMNIHLHLHLHYIHLHEYHCKESVRYLLILSLNLRKNARLHCHYLFVYLIGSTVCVRESMTEERDEHVSSRHSKVLFILKYCKNTYPAI